LKLVTSTRSAPFQRRTDELNSLLHREERLPFVGVGGGDGDDELVEDAERAVDHVEMSVCERVEAARIKQRSWSSGGGLPPFTVMLQTLNTVTIVSPVAALPVDLEPLKMRHLLPRRECSATRSRLQRCGPSTFSARSSTTSSYGGVEEQNAGAPHCVGRSFQPAHHVSADDAARVLLSRVRPTFWRRIAKPTGLMVYEGHARGAP